MSISTTKLTALLAVAAGATICIAAPASAAGYPAGPAHLTPTAARSAQAPHAQFDRAAGGRTIRYAIAKHVCGRPARGHVACDAIRLVPSRKGARGAKAYVTPAYGVGPSGGFTPADLASAYGYNPAAATNQTVAIVDAYDDPHALADLNAFDQHYGLPAETGTSFRKVNENGATSPLPSANAGWAGEIALDIESVRGVCNHCKIVLVEASAPSASDLATAVNTAARMGATEISNSYGAPEDPTAAASVRSAYDHPGIVITASTGDHGWYNWDYANDGSDGASADAPNVPAAYPSVVAVAGTALALNSDGSRQQEDVWDENGPDDQNGLFDGYWWGDQGASGGGCSFVYPAPTWQADVPGYANTGCGTKRLAGDVAALADPYTGFDVYDSYGSGGWVTTGGTSLASPIVAAMWALAGGAQGVKYPAETLYDNLRFHPDSIYDVTVGGNSFCGGASVTSCSAALEAQTTPPTGNPNNIANGNSVYANGWAGLLDCGYPYNGGAGTIAANTQCNAVTGYDGPSGVGTPHGLGLFTSTAPKVAISRPAVLKLRSAQTWSAVNFTDPVGGTATGYRWNWGDGTTSSSTGASTTHTFTGAGTHKVTVTVTDSFGQTGSASTTITVGVAPTAAISGPTRLKVGRTYQWSAARSVDKNTGARIVSWAWTLGSKKVGSRATLAHRFTGTGRPTLSLTVTDNSGLRAHKSITLTVTR